MAYNYDLGEMLTYKRPEGTKYQKKFCNRYLRPVFGEPDIFGNYVTIVGYQPRIAFMAHHDTVHKESGKQRVIKEGNFYKSVDSNCLGADCTTGVYIILKMIEAGVPGVYVVHGAEEVGCIGSAGMVAGNPDWIKHVDIAISFDRTGYSSIITHQLGARTCSDDFAESFANILDMDYQLDNGGVYTDSNEYRGVIAECTNISVGYFCQHTKSETQDINFADMLVDQLIKADWDSLVVSRDPVVEEFDYYTFSFKGGGWGSLHDECGSRKIKTPEVKDMEDAVDIIKENPVEIARLLKTLGYDAYDLIDEVYYYKRNPDDDFQNNEGDDDSF